MPAVTASPDAPPTTRDAARPRDVVTQRGFSSSTKRVTARTVADDGFSAARRTKRTNSATGQNASTVETRRRPGGATARISRKLSSDERVVLTTIVSTSAPNRSRT